MKEGLHKPEPTNQTIQKSQLPKDVELLFNPTNEYFTAIVSLKIFHGLFD